ncbi:MAG: dTMP kinase [Candidatus Bathyarchaeia archaeon]
MSPDDRGCFIAFEGIEGSGKTTQCIELTDRLKRMNYVEVVKTHEPFYEGDIGKFIRKILYKEVKASDESLALLFAADRLEHTKRMILPALERGAIVISDRYIHSSIAYQSGGMDTELDIDWLWEINKHALDPDLVIFLDVPAEEGLSRLREGQKRVQDDSFFETLEKQSKIREQYHRIYNFEDSPEDWQLTECKGVSILIIDGTLSIKRIKRIILERVKKLLQEKKLEKKPEGEVNSLKLKTFLNEI